MDLKEIHQQVDEKLEKLEAEIERFKNNIETCDEPEEREILEKDLATLHVIREKLLKAKGLSQQVSDLMHQVEHPDITRQDYTGQENIKFEATRSDERGDEYHTQEDHRSAPGTPTKCQ